MITESLAGGLTGELPVDNELLPIDLAIPRGGFPAEFGKTGHPASAQALSGKEADFDFGLVEPSLAGAVWLPFPVSFA